MNALWGRDLAVGAGKSHGNANFRLSVYRNAAWLSMNPREVIPRAKHTEMGGIIGLPSSIALPIEEAYNKERWRNNLF
jgi:hypothetical protein